MLHSSWAAAPLRAVGLLNDTKFRVTHILAMIYSFAFTDSHLSGKVYDVTEFLDGELPLGFFVL